MRRAFTLTEILIGVSIVLILAAIAFPVYRYAREAGTRSHCTQNLRQVQMAIEMYVERYDLDPSSVGALVREVPSVEKVLLCPKDASKGTEHAGAGGPRGNPDSHLYAPCSYEVLTITRQQLFPGSVPEERSTDRVVAACRWHERRQDRVAYARAVFADGHVGWWDTSQIPDWYTKWKDNQP